MSCSNNYKHCLKFLVPLSHTTFVVLNPIIFLSQQFFVLDLDHIVKVIIEV
jgi:hypothetical protein